MELKMDSKSVLVLAKNPIFHKRSKHIRVRYHFIRGCLKEGSIKASYINTKDQLADLLTKPLGRIKFLELCSRTGMVQLSHKTMHKISLCTVGLCGPRHDGLAAPTRIAFSILD
jgi:hypothetical protein